MKDKIILSKQQKIIILQILKANEMTKEQAKQIIRPFETHMTIEEAKEFRKKLDAEY
jgi:hypothetical protein